MTEELREAWAEAERDLAAADRPVVVEELTARAERLYEDYMRAKERDAKERRMAVEPPAGDVAQEPAE